MDNDKRLLHDIHDHEHSLYGELICHFPYGVFSVAFCLTLLSFLGFSSYNVADKIAFYKAVDRLFHSFHFMHIIFAATGVMLTFLRFSTNVVKAVVVGVVTTTVFCTLSDSILPYLGGRLLGVHMHWHLCFVTELHNVIPFLLIGLLNGYVLSRHHPSRQGLYSIFSHFLHILVSSLASSFYLVAHGFDSWYSDIGAIFIFLIVAVVVPCTLSDVVVPMFFAGVHKKDERY